MPSKKKNDGRRQPKLQDQELAAAESALNAAKLPTGRDRGLVWIGTDGFIGRPPKSRTLVLRFWSGAHKVYRDRVTKVLSGAQIEYETGPEFELEKEPGKKVDPNLVPQDVEEMFSKLRRTPHVRACLFCKEVLEQAALGDDEYLERAIGAVFRHAKQEQEPGAVPCQYAGCIHHEKVSRALALKMIEYGKGDEPWKDVRGVPVSTIPLKVTEKEHPEGWDFKNQDVMQRAFKNLPQAAGDIYVRLAPKETSLHVWISLPYKSRRAQMDDVASIDEMREAHDKLAPVWAKWCRKKFDDLKGLAEMDLDLDGGKEQAR
jgi:hypothetical protein